MILENTKTEIIHRATENLSGWLLSLMLVLLPLGFSWLFYDSYDLPKITLFYWGVFGLMALWFLNAYLPSIVASFRRNGGSSGDAASDSSISIMRSPLDIPALCFILLYGFSLFHSLDIKISFWGQYRSYIFGWFPIFCGGMLYWLTVQFWNKAMEKKVINAAIAGAVIGALYGILQYFGIEFSRMPKNIHGRVWSSFGNPLYFGAYCMMAIPLAIERLRSALNQKTEEKSLAVTGCWLLALILLFAGLILSLSRSAWVGLSAGLIIYSLMSFKFSNISIKSISIPVVLVVLAFAFYQPARQRFVSIFRPEGADYARFEGWKQAGRIFVENPVFGTGPDTFVYSFRKHRSLGYIRATGSDVTHAHAHNDILQYATTSGVLGLGGYLWLWFAIFRIGFMVRGSLSKSTTSCIFASVVSLFVNNQFNFWTPATLALFWVLLGLISAPYASEFVLNLRKKEADGEEHEEGSEDSKIEKQNSFPEIGYLSGALILLALCGWWVLYPLIGDYHFMKAQGYLAERNYENAVIEMEKAVEKNHRVATYYERHANVFKDLVRTSGDPETRKLLLNNAYVVTHEAAMMLPNNPDCQNNLGVVYMWITQMTGVDKRDSAKKAFQKAVEMDPNFIDAWANMAKVAHYYGDINGEIEFWKKVLEIRPDHSDANKLLPQLIEYQKGIKK